MHTIFWILTFIGPVQTSQPSPPIYGNKNDLRFYIADGKLHRVETAADWQRRRSHILASMQQVMGPLPPDRRDLPFDLQVLKEERIKTFTRKRISFVAEPGDRIEAYLFLPNGD